MTEAQIALLSFWACFCPKAPGDYIKKFGAYNVTTRQVDMVQKLFYKNLRFCQLRPKLCEGPGRGQTLFYNILKMCQDESFGESPWEKQVNQLVANALDVDPSRIALADPAGSFDPARILRPAEKEAFLNPDDRVDELLDKNPGMPKPCYRVPLDVEGPLRRQLACLN